MTKEQVIIEFQKNFLEETRYESHKCDASYRAEEIYGRICQLSEIAYESMLPRGYNTRYNLVDTNETFESVSGHTNLLMALVDYALVYEYGSNFTITSDGFTHREIIEAIRRHDLPENNFGDQPDNGNRDEEGLAKKENIYWGIFSSCSPESENYFEDRVNTLLTTMRAGVTKTGRLLRVADKAVAVFMALCSEEKDKTPIMEIDSPVASEAEKAETHICENKIVISNKIFCRASEMWTIDFFNRKFNEIDDTKFFVSLIMMKTIIVRDRWYRWRQKTYRRTTR